MDFVYGLVSGLMIGLSIDILVRSIIIFNDAKTLKRQASVMQDALHDLHDQAEKETK